MGVMRGATTVAGAVRSSSGRHPLHQRLLAIVPMLRDTLTGRWRGAPRLRVIGGLAGVLYVISPVDFIPEVLLGPFGLADDIALAAVSVAALLTAAEDYLDGRDAGAAASMTGAGDVIPGVVVDSHYPQP